MKSRFQLRSLALTLLVALCLPAAAFARDESKWLEIHTAHFSVLTDAGEKRGREVALRMEQMRAVFAQLVSRQKTQHVGSDNGHRP